MRHKKTRHKQTLAQLQQVAKLAPAPARGARELSCDAHVQSYTYHCPDCGSARDDDGRLAFNALVTFLKDAGRERCRCLAIGCPLDAIGLFEPSDCSEELHVPLCRYHAFRMADMSPAHCLDCGDYLDYHNGCVCRGCGWGTLGEYYNDLADRMRHEYEQACDAVWSAREREEHEET